LPKNTVRQPRRRFFSGLRTVQGVHCNVGPIFKIKVLGHQIVFVGSVSLLQEICDESRFRKCVSGPIVEIRYAVHDSLFAAYYYEETWGIAHRIMAPMVTASANSEIFGRMRETVSDLIKKWTSGSNQPVLVTDDLSRLNMLTAMLCFFDQRLPLLEGPEPPMLKAMDGVTWECMKRPTRPKFINSLFFKRRFENDTKTMRDFAASIVETRKSQPTERKDMLHMLLEGKDPDTGKSLTDSQVLDEIINLFIGSATAPNLVSYTLSYLLTNPQELTKAREEIDAVIGTGQIEDHHLSQLPYCEAILRESLRLCATAPGFNLEPLPSAEDPSAPVLLAGGEYQIPQDQVIIAILGAVNRDPAYFPDPEAFQPQRMLGENYDRLPPACKKGFGNGKRQCFGKLWAWQWSLLTLVSILKDVQLELADKRYELKSNGAFSVQPQKLFVLVGPRGHTAAA
jgi:cytochrome P450